MSRLSHQRVKRFGIFVEAIQMDPLRHRHVVGAHGDLCTHPDSSAVRVDYDSALPAMSMDLYYHTIPEEKWRMFPINPSINNPKLATSTGMSTRRTTFRQDVELRDLSCVVSGATADYCDAAHILPYGKGDQVL